MVTFRGFTLRRTYLTPVRVGEVGLLTGIGEFDNISNMIHQVVREARKANGLTLRELSALTGIAVANLSRLESGRTDPRVSTVLRVLGAMGLTLQATSDETLGIEDVRARMSEGAARLRRAGVTKRDVAGRLAWKEARGLDTSVERRILER